jgi:3-isopropylmalate dehydrogenase
MRCTWHGTERIVRAAFEYARAHGRERVCMADKSNAVEHTGKLWQRAFRAVAEEFPDLQARHLYIDALCMEMVRAPEQFDVIVTGNLFGDIISDLGAQLQGGMGTAASANLHPGRHGLFEPVHGTAPALAGKGLANPVGTILSAAYMLDYLGRSAVARRLEEAVARTLREGPRAADLGGQASTEAVASAIIERL